MAFEDDLLALEAEVVKAAAGDFLAAVAELRRRLLLKEPGVQRLLEALPSPKVEAVAIRGILEAFNMGGVRAIRSVENPGPKVVKAVVKAPAPVVAPVIGVDVLVRDAKVKALTLSRAGVDVETALGPVFGAANTVKATIETQINQASNMAAVLVGKAAGESMVWVAERDACVYCLALAGKVVVAGKDFPKADLYADGGSANRIVQQPPLHPHCRCQLEVLVDQSFADALEREAQRSILRGLSLGSESNAVRVRAAARLLDRDPVAPKSVKEYARRAVKNGKFDNGREVKAGGPRLVVR